MTEQEHLELLIRNANQSIAAYRADIAACEAKIELTEGYQRCFNNRLRELENIAFQQRTREAAT